MTRPTQTTRCARQDGKAKTGKLPFVGKKKERGPFDALEELDIPFDRDTEEPCLGCRKRDSCFERPRCGRCTGFEPGTPWSLQMQNEWVSRRPATALGPTIPMTPEAEPSNA